MTQLIADEIARADPADTAKKAQRAYEMGVFKLLVARCSQVLADLRSLFFSDGACAPGVLGLCFHGETVAVCYLAKPRTDTMFNRRGGASSEFVLHSIQLEQTDDPDPLSLYELCKQALGLPIHCPFPQVWVSTDLANGVKVAVTPPGSPRRALVFSIAQELGQYLSQAAADRAVSERGSSWLEQAKPPEPPIFDYKLLGSMPRTGLREVPGQDPADSDTGKAQLWWMTGYAARGCVDQLQRNGLSIAGITPDGVALYWGLRHLWQRSNAAITVLDCQWILLEGGTKFEVWRYSGPWFQGRASLDSLADLQSLGLDEHTKIVLWRVQNDIAEPLVKTLADTWTVLDDTLAAWSPGTCHSWPALAVPSIVALGSALEGMQVPSGDWQEEDTPPLINLLPWRGAWLQQRQARLIGQLVGLALLSLALIYPWFGWLQRKVDSNYQMLSAAQAQQQQMAQVQQELQAFGDAAALREAAVAQLAVHGEYGQRQLLNIEALLALVPKCFVIHRITLTKNSAEVFGLASNMDGLMKLPERIFAAFSQDPNRSLEFWPVLRVGADAANDASTSRPLARQVNRSNDSIDKEFVLRVSFAPAKAELPWRTKPSGLASVVE